jgi:tRNA-dihydrouridine synthase
MVGRGVYGRPWIAAELDAGLLGEAYLTPEGEARLAVALEHFEDSLRFYGDRLGLKIFRKHLAAYIEHGPPPAKGEGAREARARICRIEAPGEVVQALSELWREDRLAA